jgi:hypothetical protein
MKMVIVNYLKNIIEIDGYKLIISDVKMMPKSEIYRCQKWGAKNDKNRPQNDPLKNDQKMAKN